MRTSWSTGDPPFEYDEERGNAKSTRLYDMTYIQTGSTTSSLHRVSRYRVFPPLHDSCCSSTCGSRVAGLGRPLSNRCYYTYISIYITGSPFEKGGLKTHTYCTYDEDNGSPMWWTFSNMRHRGERHTHPSPKQTPSQLLHFPLRSDGTHT